MATRPKQIKLQDLSDEEWALVCELFELIEWVMEAARMTTNEEKPDKP